MSDKDGGPAFPRPHSEVAPWDGASVREHGQAGLTLRDYFAAKALPKIMEATLSEYGYGTDYDGDQPGIVFWEMPFLGEREEPRVSWADVVAESAYIIADAMLKARCK